MFHLTLAVMPNDIYEDLLLSVGIPGRNTMEDLPLKDAIEWYINKTANKESEAVVDVQEWLLKQLNNQNQ